MDYKVGAEYPVWWDTYDNRPGGNHMATILEVKPYTGKFGFSVTLRLSAPATKKGWIEMPVV